MPHILLPPTITSFSPPSPLHNCKQLNCHQQVSPAEAHRPSRNFRLRQPGRSSAQYSRPASSQDLCRRQPNVVFIRRLTIRSTTARVNQTHAAAPTAAKQHPKPTFSLATKAWLTKAGAPTRLRARAIMAAYLQLPRSSFPLRGRQTDMIQKPVTDGEQAAASLLHTSGYSDPCRYGIKRGHEYKILRYCWSWCTISPREASCKQITNSRLWKSSSNLP